MITPAEYKAAVTRASTECQQEIAAASLEYREAVRPIASIRKARGRSARKKRDEKILDLKDQLAEAQEAKKEKAEA